MTEEHYRYGNQKPSKPVMRNMEQSGKKRFEPSGKTHSAAVAEAHLCLQGKVFNMQHKRSNRARSLLFTVMLWLCGVALLFLIKVGIELFEGPIAETWIDLALVLTAYLLFFLLDPLQTWISHRLRKRTRRNSRLHRTS